MANDTRLAVILHADVAGSTALVRADERLAHDGIQRVFRVLSRIISAEGGATHEVRGDALVAEFRKASDAARAALRFQSENRAGNANLDGAVRPQLRVGIALGEVVVADNAVTGAGVVLAQRLEQLAAPGGICISAAIREALPGRLRLRYEDLGEHRLKGFDFPQRAFSLTGPVVTEGAVSATARDGGRTDGDEVGAVAQRASIAVLPFDNLSSDPEQQFFADGMADDVITALSKFKELLVIARNTTFTYKGRSVDVATIARELGVGYVLEGSIRKAGDRIRVTAQLIEVSGASHLWAERYDCELHDIFQVQDEVTEKIVAAIAPELELAQQVRIKSRPPENLDAWGCYQLARSAFRTNREGLETSARFCREAIGRDPGFAAAHAWLAMVRFYEATLLPTQRRAGILQQAHVHAREAASLDATDAMAHVVLARVLGASGNGAAAEREARRAVALNPNLWWAHHALGSILVFVNGEPEGAIAALAMATRLNPRDPHRWATELVTGVAYRMLGRYEDAIVFGRMSCESGDYTYLTHANLAASLALAGQLDDAREAFAVARQREPLLSIGYLEREYGVGPRPAPGLIEGLRAAGLAE